VSKFSVTVSALLVATLSTISSSAESALVQGQPLPKYPEVGERVASGLPAVDKQPSLEDFVRLSERNEGYGGGRGEVCTVAPLPPALAINSRNAFVSDRPIFIWQGAANQIEVRQVADRKLIWEKDLKPQESVATYPTSGQALLPNQEYELRLLTSNEETRVRFKVASPDQRQQIQAGLQAQVKQLSASQRTPAAIAVKQAIYLGEQKFWPDAFGKVFSVKQSEIPKSGQAAWNRGLSEIRSSVCGRKLKS